MALQDISESSFLGTGWSFPPTFNTARESVEMVSAEEDIRQSLHILFTTQFGERIMRSDYGSRIAAMPFEPLDNSQAILIGNQARNSILLHEPRVVPVDVKVTMDVNNGRVEVFVDYRIAATNTRRNFVYPFYLIEGTEVKK
jgi:phage baseplate assembly protein W